MSVPTTSTAKSDFRHGPATAPIVFSDVREAYLEAGIDGTHLAPLIPSRPRMSPDSDILSRNFGKVPGIYNSSRKDWRGMFWKFLSQGLTAEQQREVASFPTENMGIRGAAYGAIDSDVESPAARDLVDWVVQHEFADWNTKPKKLAIRTRGKSPRVLYAFKCDGLVKSYPGAVKFTLAAENHAIVHTVEVKASGSQWVAEGQHPGGEWYGWEDGADIVNLVADGQLQELTDGAMVDFIGALVTAIEAKDKEGKMIGKIVKLNKSGSSAVDSDEWDPATVEPLVEPEIILAALAGLNTQERYPDRPIGLVSAIKAGLGCDAEEFRDKVCAVLAETSGGWCSLEYIEDIWDSIVQVRVDRYALDTHHFRKHGINVLAGKDFPVPTPQGKADTAAVIRTAEEDEYHALKARWESGYRIMAEDAAGDFPFPSIRPRNALKTVLKAERVWKGLAGDAALVKLVRDTKAYFNRGKKKDPDPADPTKEKKDIGPSFNTFKNKLQETNPKAVYDRVIRDLRYRKGEVVSRVDSDGNTLHDLNFLPKPGSQVWAENPPSDRQAAQAEEDVALYEKFVRRGFGDMADFEMNVMADMLKNDTRPGFLLYLVGVEGVGKSLYIEIQMRILNGQFDDSPNGEISASELLSSGARRFVLGTKEGCRGLNVNETEKTTREKQIEIISWFKRVVDTSPKNDKQFIEKKNQTQELVPTNFRLFVSANPEHVLPMERGSRRIQYVEWEMSDAADNLMTRWELEELVAILRSDERLAAIVRMLKARDIGEYKSTNRPPSSMAKDEAQAMNPELSDTEKHGWAAFMKLRQDGRTIFTGQEFVTLMADMAGLQYRNKGRDDIDARPVTAYSFKAPNAEMQKVIGMIAQKATKLVLEKHTEIPTTYVMHDFDTNQPNERVIGMRKLKPRAVENALDEDRNAHPFTTQHRMPEFAGRLPSLGASVNDNAAGTVVDLGARQRGPRTASQGA